MNSILIIEDDLTFSRILEGFLKKNKFSVTTCNSGKEGLNVFNRSKFDLVLLDYRLPDFIGLDILQTIKQNSPTVAVIMMTSFNDVRTAINAIRLGANDYILKPINPEELLLAVNQASARNAPPSVTKEIQHASYLEGESDSSQNLHRHIKLVAPTDLSVIIKGESGTGKEFVARRIHELSNRASMPFIAVDCGAISKELAASELFGHVKGAYTGAIADGKGKFELANQGTLFLDEIGNLTYDVQVKLLRAIQERIIQPLGSDKQIKVNVRIIAASNEDLLMMVKAGRFREDLYHRLNEFDVSVSPLRERDKDMLQFASLFREQANAELGRTVSGFELAVMKVFEKYNWPGNLRELKNVVKRAVLFTSEGTIRLSALPSEMVMTSPGENPGFSAKTNPGDELNLKYQTESRERELIVKTLLKAGNNKSKAARLLHIDRKTLYLKMEKYGIE